MHENVIFGKLSNLEFLIFNEFVGSKIGTLGEPFLEIPGGASACRRRSRPWPDSGHGQMCQPPHPGAGHAWPCGPWGRQVRSGFSTLNRTVVRAGLMGFGPLGLARVVCSTVGPLHKPAIKYFKNFRFERFR